MSKKGWIILIIIIGVIWYMNSDDAGKKKQEPHRTDSFREGFHVSPDE